MQKLILRYMRFFSRFTKACSLLLVQFFCMVLQPVQAQTDTSKKLREVKIVTSPIPPVQTLAPAQQISSSDFDRYSAFNAADAIRNFAGVNIKDYGGIGGLKTVSVRSLGANHLGVLYDGVELNDAETGQVDLGRINLNNIQAITLYNGQPPAICQPARAFASASVLNIITIRPSLDSIKPYLVQFGLKGGSFGLINPYIQWQQRMSKQWSFVLNSYMERANGQYKYKVDGDSSDTLATRNNSDINIRQIDGALYWIKDNGSQFNLHVNYYYSDRGLPGAVIFYNPYSSARLKDEDVFIQSGYSHTWQNSLHLLINSKFSREYTRYADPLFLNSTGGTDNRYTDSEFYQSACLAYDLNPNWQVSYAADVLLSKLSTNLANYVYPTRITLFNVLASNLTICQWVFQASLLATNINESVESGTAASPVSVVSPTIMADFHVDKSLQLRAFYKNIFRAPSFNEQYFFAVVKSRNIKPEYARQFDVGLTYSKGLRGLFNYLTITADGYDNQVTDKIIIIPNQNPVISSVINLGAVHIKGIDIGAKTQATLAGNNHFLLSVNYTLQQALDVTDPSSEGQPYSTYKNQIPYTPEHTLSFNAGFVHQHIGVYYNQVLSAYYYFLGQNIESNFVPGYSVSDLMAVYNFNAKNKPLTLSAGMDNVFNNRYAIVRSFPMPGRSLLISIQITI